jgi:hypothetical protein
MVGRGQKKEKHFYGERAFSGCIVLAFVDFVGEPVDRICRFCFELGSRTIFHR